MPEKRNPSLNDAEMYEARRDVGASKQEAARISKTAAKTGRSAVGRKSGSAGAYEDWTVAQLRDKAKENELMGCSGKRKQEIN